MGTAVCGRYSCGENYVLELSSATGRHRSSGSSVPKKLPLSGRRATRDTLARRTFDKMLPRR